jgi:hypothetical protein
MAVFQFVAMATTAATSSLSRDCDIEREPPQVVAIHHHAVNGSFLDHTSRQHFW